MGFDLNEIRLKEEGTDMAVTHPVTFEVLTDENGEPATIKLAGMDSAIYRKTQNAIANRRAKKAKGNLLKLMSAEQTDADAFELICRCTLGWKNLVIDGAEPTTAEELYKGRQWLQDQASAWIHDRANYLGN